MKKRKTYSGQIVLHLLFLIMVVMYIVPFLLMISISVTPEKILAMNGYSVIPRDITFDAYKLAFQNPKQILSAYKVTAIYSSVATALSVLVMSLLAYPLARSNFKFKGIITFIVFFTMLFSGGMVPSYLLITKYLHLDDTIWVYIVPHLVSAWNVIVIRTNFKSIPESLIESAKIDGASELYICFRIVFPLSKPTLAAVGFLILVPKWNDWFTSMLYIKDPSLYSLQYLLQRILTEIEFLKSLAKEGMTTLNQGDMFPTESFKYAMAIIAAGPVMFIFPFFQKYFAKGLTIGAVKG